MSKQENVYRHVVLFKFYDKVSPETVEKIEAAFRDFCASLPFVKDFEFGRNSSAENRNEGFTHCFIVTFENEQGRDQYIPHPEHLAFKNNYLVGNLEKSLVIDFTSNK